MKLSIVITGRNDDYGGDFKARVLAAAVRNHAETLQRHIDIEPIFVEWNPPNEDYLSYTLADKGFKCYIVDPAIHRAVIDPQVRDKMTFMQYRAKNIGVRRATGDWIITTNADCVFDDQVWDFIAARSLNPEMLYRAERCDIDWRLFLGPFSAMRENVILCHDTQGGTKFTQAAGDFLMFATENATGFDENINFAEAHLDGRFCLNWSAVRSNGATHNLDVLQFIGTVFKADHPLIFARAQGGDAITHKGVMLWSSMARTCEKPALYENPDNWGLVDAPERQLRERIWFIG